MTTCTAGGLLSSNKDASFWSLRAYGAFLVSAQIKANLVGGVKIVSEKNADCTAVNPWQSKQGSVGVPRPHPGLANKSRSSATAKKPRPSKVIVSP